MRSAALTLLAMLCCAIENSNAADPPSNLLALKKAQQLATPPMVWKRPAALDEGKLGATSTTAASTPAAASRAPALGLPALLARALPQDAQVQSAQAALTIAQARYRQVRSRLFPTLGIQASHGHSSDLDGRLSVARKTQQAELSLRWNVYQGGTDYNELIAAEAELSAAEAEVRRAKDETAERLADAYFELLRLQNTRHSAAIRLSEVQKLVAQVTRQYAEGKLSELDLQQAQNAELDAELASSTLDADYQSALIRLRLLAGGEFIEAIVEANLGRITPSDTVRNPTLMAAQARATAAQLRIRSWAATLAPKIDLNLRRLLLNHTTPPPSSLQQHGWSIGMSWEWPLGGENLGRRDESLARATQAEAEVKRAEMAIRAEFAALAPRLANLRRAVLNLAEQESKMAQLLRASDIQFEAGRRSLQQIIQSQDSYFNLQQRQHEQQQRLWQAQMRQLALAGQLLESLGLEVGP